MTCAPTGAARPAFGSGREIRYRVSDVVYWLDGLREPSADLQHRERVR